MPELAIFGSSDLATLLAHHARQLGWTIAGFIDNRVSVGHKVFDFGEVLGGIEDVRALHGKGKFEALAIGVGYQQFAYRAEAFARFVPTIPFANLIHRSAAIDVGAKVGKGVVVLPGCAVDTGVVLEDNVLLNTGVVVAHHTVVGAHSFVGPGAAIAGKVTIGPSSFIGANATVIDHRRLGPGARVGAGAVVIEDIIDDAWHVGNPARPVLRTPPNT